MKKTHLFLILVIAAAIGCLVMTAGDMSSYSSFADAAKSDQKVKVVGTLCKDKPVEYNPEKDANFFSFYMKDEKGEERKVVLLAAKPQDFERTEQIVLTGQAKGNEFYASDMLMKCPSKYKDEEVRIKSKA
jgi:cytochrome c-type biogenesis protein CcmE